jgi:DNA polymerase III subunit epsilon
MRQIILDTETTGLNARLGDRIIEVGCLEMVNRRFTGNNWHRYLNPDKAIEEGAKAIHGISDEFLADKPRFADIASEFLEYVRDAELVIHNAAFDMEFLDAELARLKLGRMADHGVTVTDTLKLARELHPGKRNSLDAHPAWGPAGCRTTGRGLSRHDSRAGQPGHRHGCRWR